VLFAWAQFCYKMWGVQLDVNPLYSSGLCGSKIM